MALRLTFVLSAALLSAKAAPLGRPGGIYARGQHLRQSSEIASLVQNIADKPVSDDAGLAQTLASSLFGGSDNSSSPSTLGNSSATISDPFAQITGDASIPTITLPTDASMAESSDSPFTGNASPSVTITGSGPIISQYTLTTTFPVPTGSGGDSEADAFSILSNLMGAVPTLAPGHPVVMSPPSGGLDEPGSEPDFPGTQGGYSQGAQASGCTETYTVVPGDTCAAIWTVFDLSAADFLRMNPTVGAACMNLRVGQDYCVQRGIIDGEDDEEEDDGGPNTVVHVHTHSKGTLCTCQGPSGGGPTGGYSPNNISVPPVPSTSPDSDPSSLPISDPLTSNPGLNSTGFNFTSTTPGFPTSSLAQSSSNSTGSGSEPDTVSMGDILPGDNTSADPFASQPTPSGASLGPDDPLSTSASGMDGMGTLATVLAASPTPRTVKLTLEENY